MRKPCVYVVSDTESTQPKRPEDAKGFKTEVWGCGFCQLFHDDIHIYNNMEVMLDDLAYFYDGYEVKLYFVNLAWDAMLLLYKLASEFNFKRSNAKYSPGMGGVKTIISDVGQWYQVQFNWKGTVITCIDLHKLLPFSVELLASGFDTKHKKLKGEIDYTVRRYQGWKITDSERAYLENDIFVGKEALEKVVDYGLLDHLTIASTCLDFYKEMMGQKYDLLFPQIGRETDEALREAYRGGWCYVNPKYADKVYKNVDGHCYDVTSLYPYSLYSKTNPGDKKHLYPVGLPIYHGNDERRFYEALNCPNTVFVVKIKISRLRLKKNHFPFLQEFNSRREHVYITRGDDITLTLTQPDYELMLEQYDVDLNAIELIDLWVFSAVEGIFDKYIDYWFRVKEQATKDGNKALRQLAKLFLNSFYGRLAIRMECGSKVFDGFDKDKKRLVFVNETNERKGVYLPAGIFCTAYARGVTVRAAQANWENFVYSDTDSLYLLAPGKGFNIDPIKLGMFKEEIRFDMCRFVRQKTYVCRVVEEDGEATEPHWKIKACGCPENVKERIMHEVEPFEELRKVTDKESKDYGKVLNPVRSDDWLLEHFTFGLVQSGKLMKKTVEGGCILVDSTFKINK